MPFCQILFRACFRGGAGDGYPGGLAGGPKRGCRRTNVIVAINGKEISGEDSLKVTVRNCAGLRGKVKHLPQRHA